MILGLQRRLWHWIAAIGAFAVLAICGASGALASPVRPYALARVWPAHESDSTSIAVNPALGRVYVATDPNKLLTGVDKFNPGQIEMYGLDGQYLGAFPDAPASEAGNFYGAEIAVSPISGDVYEADTSTFVKTIREYSAEGAKIASWTVNSPDPATFLNGIAVAPGSGDVYVTIDYGVLRYTPSGTLIGSWGHLAAPSAHLEAASGIAVASSGDVYVNDSRLGIEQFSASGAFVRSWRFPNDNSPIDVPLTPGLAVDPVSGNVFAVSTLGETEEFTGTGRYLGEFGEVTDTIAVMPGAGAVYVDSGAIHTKAEVLEYVPGTIPVITRQPVRQTVRPGKTATFVAAATGDPSPQVGWQRSTNGGRTWRWIPGAVHRTLRIVKVTARMNGYRYRAAFSNGVAPVVTRSAELRVT